MRVILATLLALQCAMLSFSVSAQAAAEKLPDQIRTQEIKDLKFGMFICWSFSSVSGQEWTKDPHGPEFFSVTGCDTDQWCEVARAAGMNYILFLTKHHDGFCLWDTETSDLKVTRSPLEIDVLKKLKESCDKHRLKLALYYSEGDWLHPRDTPGELKAAAEYKKAQLRELCTQYGPIEFFWMDHAACGDGGLSHEETVEWIHKFQPDCFVGFNHGDAAGRLCLRERGTPGELGDPDASKYNKDAEKAYNGYLAAEFTYPISSTHWFDNPAIKPETYHSPEKIFEDYLGAVKFGNILSLDVGPAPDGRLREREVQILNRVGEMIMASSTAGRDASSEADKVETSLHQRWQPRFKKFVIAAWCPPSPCDTEYRFYKEAGFNLVMGPRHTLPDKALELAEKHDLMVMVDTYTKNDEPWGGTAGPYTPHPYHHPATLPELKWLHEKYGNHPALAGYLLGDDYGALPPELIETNNWMRENAPHLFPWICQNNFQPASLAAHGNPMANPQIYPTLYKRDLPAAKQAELFCQRLDELRVACQKYDLISWPMFNVSAIDTNSKFESDSLTRFQIYASLAYGAQGLWYFTYRGYGSLTAGKEDGVCFETDEEMKKHLDPKWHVAQEANRKVAWWGHLLLGAEAGPVDHSGSWSPPGCATPGKGELIEEMSDDLLVGILKRQGQPDMALIVDKRVDKAASALGKREVKIVFDDNKIGEVSLTLQAGEGELRNLKHPHMPLDVLTILSLDSQPSTVRVKD